jgi:shikimate dehydrogenase
VVSIEAVSRAVNEIDSPRVCVAGWPIAHSRSPLIHTHWLKTLGIAGRYERAAVAPGEFAAFAEKIGRDDLVGANITIPHKEAAFSACDWVTPTATGLGAVNTLWRSNGKLCGDNTDVAGFLANMDDQAPGWASGTRCAVLIGAGGAARAILMGLISSGVDRVVVINRTFDRAARVAEQFGGKARPELWDSLPQLLGEADLLVNTSSLGMVCQPALEIDLARLSPQATVADIVYVPLETPLLREARGRGLRSVEGLGMLLHQAAPGFERWFGVRPTVTPELRALIASDILQSSKDKS